MDTIERLRVSFQNNTSGTYDEYLNSNELNSYVKQVNQFFFLKSFRFYKIKPNLFIGATNIEFHPVFVVVLHFSNDIHFCN